MIIPLTINAATTQLEQMAQYLRIEPINNRINIPSTFGTGFIQYYELPYQIQLHHYQYCLHTGIEVRGENRVEDGLYMININLSHRILHKSVGNGPVSLSKSGKSGVLFYSPGLHSQGKNELNVAYEVVFFSFPYHTYQSIKSTHPTKEIAPPRQFCLYDELTEELDQQLRKWLSNKDAGNFLVEQGAILQLLGQIVSQFDARDSQLTTTLNAKDVERQFIVKELLLNHLYGNPPTIASLAQSIHVSPSKLKTDFKALFGKSVYQYYLSKKMEMAKEMIAAKEGTIAEIGYALGYSNISQFSAQFKKRFGLSPSQWIDE